MTRRLSIAFYPFLIFFLTHCGSGFNNDTQKIGSVPANWGKYLADGSISATLKVFNSHGHEETKQPLTVDLQTGTVKSPEFQLPIGGTYRFVVVFDYAVSSSPSVPYAFADFKWQVDEFSEQVSFNESDIRYSAGSNDPTVSADISSGVLPNLDLDNDGYSNWQELRDHVNPRDPNSIPIPPSVEITAQQDGTGSTATITVVAKDNSRVEELHMVDPICGITVLSDETVNNNDGTVTRTQTVRLDLLSVAGNSRNLQALASDGVTAGQNANGVLSFSLSGDASKPYFAFTQPEENSEIEGNAVFQGIACSRKPIDPQTLRFQNSEIDQFTWHSADGAPETYLPVSSETVDTTLLPDGPVNLVVSVRDQNNQVGQGSRAFSVINDSQIKVVQPVGRRWVFGNEAIAVSVKNSPDSNIVVIEGGNLFTLTSSTSGGAVGVLKVPGLEEGTEVPVTIRAVRSDGSEVVRVVKFTVRNRPQMEFTTQASQVFNGWSTHLIYTITNVDPSQVFMKNEVAGDFQFCHEDPVMKGITVCEGSFPAKITFNKNFSLEASRAPTAGEVCDNQCDQGQNLFIQRLGGLNPDIPVINVAYGPGDDDPLAKLTVPTNPTGLYYHLTLTNLRDDGIDFDQEKHAGSTFTLGQLQELEPRTDYLAVLQILNAPGGTVQSEIFKEVTTGDLGLVGWWRFRDNPFAQDCPGENSITTICDNSGHKNSGNPFPKSGNSLSWLEPDGGFLMGSLKFDGLEGYFSVNDGSKLNSPNITVESIFQLDGKVGEQQLVDKRAGNGSGYDLRISQNKYPLEALWLMKRPDAGEEFTGKANILEMNKTYYLVGTFEDQLQQIMRLYLNGSKVDELALTIPNDRSLPNTEPLIVGKLSWDNNFYFQGLIEEIAIYNRSLCEHEIWENCLRGGKVNCGLEPTFNGCN